jgi:hypothetical protein
MKGLIVFIGFLIFLILILIRYLFVLQSRVDDLRYKNSGLKIKNEELQKRIMTLKIWNESYEKTQKNSTRSPRSKKKSSTEK